MAAFDTLRASRRLRDEGGFSDQQAETIVGAFSDDSGPRLATLDDIDRLAERLRHYVVVRVGAMTATATALILAGLAVATAIIVSS